MKYMSLGNSYGPTIPSLIPIRTRSEDGRIKGTICSKFSKSPKKFLDSRLALNFTSSSCVDLNLEKKLVHVKHRTRILNTQSTREFPSPVFPFCRLPRLHCYHPRQMHIGTGGAKKGVCRESSRVTICPTSSPSVPACPSVGRVVIRVKHTPASQCFLNAPGSQAYLGMCQSQKALRGVSACLHPMLVKHFLV